ncbi:MAG: Chorismate mutase type, partial [Verrucomicrobiota bacterium]
MGSSWESLRHTSLGVPDSSIASIDRFFPTGRCKTSFAPLASSGIVPRAMSLQEHRQAIDALDADIVRLLNERTRHVLEIGAIKTR